MTMLKDYDLKRSKMQFANDILENNQEKSWKYFNHAWKKWGTWDLVPENFSLLERNF